MRHRFWLLFLFLILTNSCQQKAPEPSATATPIPPAPSIPIATPSLTPEASPQIRTSELQIEMTAAPAIASQQNLEFTPRGLTIANGQPTSELLSEKIVIDLASPAPFLALSAKWTSIISQHAKLTVSVRASINGNDWGAWQLSSLDGDPRTQAGLFFFPPESKFIQYRIEMERDSKRAAPLLQNIRFRFISPGATPKSEFDKLRASQLLTRTNWHCPASSFKAKANAGRINHLIVHHTATANDAQDWPAVVRTIWNFHAVTNGWRDVGYHYLIDPNGVIYEGRAGGDNVAGIHFSCANTGTMGIAMLGNFLSTAPTAAAIQSLEKLLAQKCEQLQLDPLGQSFHTSTRMKLPHIAGHQDANQSPAASVCKGTHCPGDALYALLPTIRNTVAQTVSLRRTMARTSK